MGSITTEDTEAQRLHREDLSAYLLQQTYKVVGMFLFDCENTFEHPSRRRIVGTEVIDHLAITIDRNTLSDKILFYHVSQRSALDVLRVTAHQQTFGIEIRLAL